jgi:hypothetical protein
VIQFTVGLQMEDRPMRRTVSVIAIVGALVLFPIQAFAVAPEIEQVQKDIDNAWQTNRTAVENAVNSAANGNWASAAGGLLRSLPKASILQLFSGNRQAMERMVQYFPEAFQYAGTKAGQPVSLPPATAQDTTKVQQVIDSSIQSQRDAIQNAVKAAQVANYSDAVQTLCALPGMEQDRCVKVFPTAIRYAGDKIGQPVALTDAQRSGQEASTSTPSSSSSPPASTAGRTCIRDEGTQQIHCGQVVR